MSINTYVTTREGFLTSLEKKKIFISRTPPRAISLQTALHSYTYAVYISLPTRSLANDNFYFCFFFPKGANAKMYLYAARHDE